MSFHQDGMLIISSIPVFTKGVVWAAGLSNRPCWVMSDEPATPSWRHLPHVLGIERISTERLEAAQETLLESVSRFCADRAVGLIVAADTRSNRFLRHLAPRLAPSVECFPMCSGDLFERLYDKATFANLIAELDLPGPSTCVVSSESETVEMDPGPPYVLKPAQGEGGDGIVRVDGSNDLAELIARRAHSRYAPIIVQEWIPGEDIDISLLADRGRRVAWTIQQHGKNGEMRFVRDDDVLALATRLVEGTGYHGVIHLDMRIDHRSGEVLLIEANPRFWGTLCYSVWSGVNFLDLGIRMMRGQDVAAMFREVECSCPYLGPTRSSIGRDLLGGWPTPKGLTFPQKRAWRFHHGRGSGALRTAAQAWLDRARNTNRRVRAEPHEDVIDG